MFRYEKVFRRNCERKNLLIYKMPQSWYKLWFSIFRFFEIISFFFFSSPSVSHGFLQSPTCHRIHVWGSGHPQHRRAAQDLNRFPKGSIHQGNQGWVTAHTQSLTPRLSSFNSLHLHQADVSLAAAFVTLTLSSLWCMFVNRFDLILNHSEPIELQASKINKAVN